MLAVAVLVTLFAASGNADISENEISNRVIWGEPARIEDFPSTLYFEAVTNTTNSTLCGATILSAEWAMTAAHCAERHAAPQVTLRAGSSLRSTGGSVHQVAEIIMHEEYDRIYLSPGNHYLVNDVALLKVLQPFPLNNQTVRAALLPAQGQDTPIGATGTIAGWGKTAPDGMESETLQEIGLVVMTPEFCRRLYQLTNNITDICLRSPDLVAGICFGDSGSPLYVDDVVVGHSSWGSCIPPNPPVCTRLSNYRDWIAEKTGL